MHKITNHECMEYELNQQQSNLPELKKKSVRVKVGFALPMYRTVLNHSIQEEEGKD